MTIKSILTSLTYTGSDFTREGSTPNRQCSEFEVNNWAISKFVVHKLVPIVDVFPFPLNEQMLMVAAVCRLKPTHIFEWGTNIGKSARIFYETCKALSVDTEIHSIDLPDDVEHAEHPGAKRGVLVKNIEAVKLHLGDGLETSLRILEQCGNRQTCPLFFLDGDHSYSSVKRELTVITEKVPDANILLHDTFYQPEESGYNIGPYQAIVDVVGTESGTYRVLSQNIGLPGMTLLWQQPDLRIQ
jgi:predicted O-methyltransferase YrrM